MSKSENPFEDIFIRDLCLVNITRPHDILYSDYELALAHVMRLEALNDQRNGDENNV